MNKIILIGRLAQDPEVRYTQTGKALCRFTLAVGCRRKNNVPDFIDCVAWEKLGETCGNYLAKGRQVAVEGRIQIRTYQSDQGEKRRVTEIVCSDVSFLDSPRQKQIDWPSRFGHEVEDSRELPF